VLVHVGRQRLDLVSCLITVVQQMLNRQLKLGPEFKLIIVGLGGVAIISHLNLNITWLNAHSHYYCDSDEKNI
jgi:hypothetical protein